MTVRHFRASHSTRLRLLLRLTALAGLCFGFVSVADAQSPKRPSRIVKLSTNSVASEATADFVQTTPSGTTVGAFTVPVGQVFVMTSMHIFPDSYSTGTLGVQIIQNTTLNREFFRVPTFEPTLLDFGAGIVFESNSTLSISNAFAGDPSIRVHVTGFLAPDV